MLAKYLMVLYLVGLSHQLRIKRQEDGEFWWLKEKNATEPVASTEQSNQVESDDPTVNERQEGKLNQEAVAAILSKGPEGAGLESPHPDQCVCVPYYQCQENDIITDGAGIIDIRFKPKNASATAKDVQDVKKVDDIDAKSLVGGNCPGSIEVCCQSPVIEPPVEIAPIKEAAHLSLCGLRNTDGVNVRITNFKDNEAQYGEFPWMVAILRPTLSASTGKINDVFVCGGSLIHPQVVLTAAHCVVGKDATTLKIRVGEWDTQSAYEFFPHQDRNVVDAVVHEKYYPAALFNDIALLFLDAPIDPGPEADTICLPGSQDIYETGRCFATGWGKDQFGQAGKYQHILKKIQLPIVPREDCQKSLRETRLGPNFRLDESFICAGGEPGKDTCRGDGGSPLVCPIVGTKSTRYVQVGIVAWGIGCGGQVPGVYANIPRASAWIQEKITVRMKLAPEFFIKQLP